GHGGEQGQTGIGELGGLVADPDDVPLPELRSEFRVRGQMEVREQDLTGSQHLDLVGSGLFDLQNQLGLAEHVFDAGDDPRALTLVPGIVDAGAGPCVLFHQNGVPSVDEFPHSDWSHGYPLLGGLGLSRHSDDHRALLSHSRRAIRVFPSIKSPLVILSRASAIGTAWTVESTSSAPMGSRSPNSRSSAT